LGSSFHFHQDRQVGTVTGSESGFYLAKQIIVRDHEMVE
jgi:hypothetical protein